VAIHAVVGSATTLAGLFFYFPFKKMITCTQLSCLARFWVNVFFGVPLSALFGLKVVRILNKNVSESPFYGQQVESWERLSQA